MTAPAFPDKICANCLKTRYHQDTFKILVCRYCLVKGYTEHFRKINRWWWSLWTKKHERITNICPRCKKGFHPSNCYAFCNENCLHEFVAKNDRNEPDQMPKSKKVLLSSKEIEYLVEKAQSYVDSRDFNQAVLCYNKVIESSPRQPHYFRARACAFASLAVLNNAIADLDKAIKDINIAIELDPDNGENYWRRGAFLTYRLTIERNLSRDKRKHILQEIITNYEDSIKKNPSHPQLWLDTIEVNVLLNNWDDAIGKYGQCQPYINSKEDKLIRAWLGCISMIFAGDLLEEEDTKPLSDQAVRLNKSHWYIGNINTFLDEIGAKENYKDKWKKAKEIHQLFISHFDESPW